MMSEYMKLISKNDARQWAADYDLDEKGTDNLADWIWDVKPEIGCTKDEHPLSEISDEEFWNIVEG